MSKLCRREKIILYRISWTEKLYILKSNNATQCFKLNVFRQGGRKTVDIAFNSIPTFRLYKYLMPIFIGKAVYFIFNRRTVSRPKTLNRTIEHWRSIKTFTQQIMHF